MTEAIARKLLDVTAESYRKIARPFSDTRNRIWTDCTAFASDVKKGAHVLDVGCGNGKLVPWLLEKDISSYTGIDLNPEFIRIAKERYLADACTFLEGDILTLNTMSLGKQQFDVVLCIAVLHHLPSERMRIAALKNLRECLSEGGVLIMTNWNFFETIGKKSIWRYAYERMAKHTSSREYPDLSWRDMLTHWKSNEVDEILYYHAFTPRELKKLLRLAGFERIECWYTSNGARAHWWNGRNISTIAYV